MAAVLACGDGAVLSHGSAAALWGLLRPIAGPVHVSIPSQQGRSSRPGIRLHRCSSLARRSGPRRITRRNRIPITTVARTIEDLRGVVPPELIRRAIRQAELGGHRLDGIESDRTRSDVERDFLALCRRHRLPSPEVNIRIGRWEVDFVWSQPGVAVEADTFTYHRGSVAFEDDHARDLDLRRHGLAVLRFTARQIETEPESVAADVAAELRRRTVAPRP
jgi:very-short-patch-repair endonuclease